MELPQGTFGWVDLMTSDVPAAKASYPVLENAAARASSSCVGRIPV